MQPPGFWYARPDAPGTLVRLLTPLGWAWTAVTRSRMRRLGARSTVPVICIGNLVAGGTGKTPVVAATAQRLRERGVDGQVLSRGYGGRLPGPLRVDPAKHGAEDVGDEPLLLAAFAPTWVSRDRAAGARAMADAGAAAVVMDDGFQNPSLAKDISIVVVDAETGFGNGRVIPAGPLREAVADGLARADLVLSIGPDPAQGTLADRYPDLQGRPRVSGRLKPLETGMDWARLRCLAFAGIGRPKKFYDTLSALGADVRATRSFPDHAGYSRTIIQRLGAEAARLNAQLVTTEKDAVRLPPDLRTNVITLPVRLDLDDWGPLDALLAPLFPSAFE